MMCSRLIALAAAAGLTACASSPSPTYLMLAAPQSAPVAQAGQRVVLVGPVSVPENVDRPQLMVHTSANRVEAVANLRWAQPYKIEFARALAAHLALAAANPRVVPMSAAVPAEPHLRLSVDVLSVELREGESASLEVLWVLRESPGGKELISQRSVLREVVNANGGEALVAAQDRALARLAAEITPALGSSQNVGKRAR